MRGLVEIFHILFYVVQSILLIGLESCIGLPSVLFKTYFFNLLLTQSLLLPIIAQLN